LLASPLQLPSLLGSGGDGGSGQSTPAESAATAAGGAGYMLPPRPEGRP